MDLSWTSAVTKVPTLDPTIVPALDDEEVLQHVILMSLAESKKGWNPANLVGILHPSILAGLTCPVCRMICRDAVDVCRGDNSVCHSVCESHTVLGGHCPVTSCFPRIIPTIRSNMNVRGMVEGLDFHCTYGFSGCPHVSKVVYLDHHEEHCSWRQFATTCTAASALDDSAKHSDLLASIDSMLAFEPPRDLLEHICLSPTCVCDNAPILEISCKVLPYGEQFSIFKTPGFNPGHLQVYISPPNAAGAFDVIPSARVNVQDGQQQVTMQIPGKCTTSHGRIRVFRNNLPGQIRLFDLDSDTHWAYRISCKLNLNQSVANMSFDSRAGRKEGRQSSIQELLRFPQSRGDWAHEGRVHVLFEKGKSVRDGCVQGR